MKGRLHQLALLSPQRSITGQQAISGKRAERPFDEPRLMELLRLFDEHLTREIGMVQLIDPERADTVVGEISKLPRQRQTEFQRIERKPPWKELRDDGQQKIHFRTGWVSAPRHEVPLSSAETASASW